MIIFPGTMLHLTNGLLFLLSTLSATSDVSYMIALRQEGMPQLQEHLLTISDPHSPHWGHYLTHQQIRQHVSPPRSEKFPLLVWLEWNQVNFTDHGDAIECHSDLKTAIRMWKIEMGTHETDLQHHHIFHIPTRFRSLIDFIEGPHAPLPSYHHRIYFPKDTANFQPDSRHVGREALQRLYNITRNEATGASVASIEYQNDAGFSPTDLTAASYQNGEDPQKMAKVVGKNIGVDTESQLDVQMEALMAQNSTLWFWDEPDWLYSFAVKFASQHTIPEVISMSWGWAEDSQCQIASCQNTTSQQYIQRVNNEYIKIGLRGVTILVASGDAGAPGRTSEGCNPVRPVNPVMPGSSPWITSVSATFVNQSDLMVDWKTPLCQSQGCTTGKTEVPTGADWTGWTTGGGFSIYASENRPTWQKKAVSDFLAHNPLPSNFNKKGRGYPDVSAIGHNCPVILDGQLYNVDGTSCSAPIWAGIVATLNSYQKSRGKPVLGFLNPMLYAMWEDDPTLFQDIQVGNNWCTEEGCCPVREDGGSDFGYGASKGWDPVTGLGTPNVGRMIEWISRNNSSNW